MTDQDLPLPIIGPEGVLVILAKKPFHIVALAEIHF
jgi:hypothetical protein